MDAEDKEPKTGPKADEQEEPKDEGHEDPKADDPKGDGSDDPKADEQEEPKDKHGQPGINREKYERDMKAKDDEIAKLKAQIAEESETKEGRAALDKKVKELEESIADERVTFKLEIAGCKNVKAAKALLDDYEGDVDKLKSECPYLFGEDKKHGSTGGKPAGSIGKSIEDKIDAVFDS